MTRQILRTLICLGTIAVLIALGNRTFAQSVPATVTVTVIPNAPTDLTAVPTSANQVLLTWANNAVGADYVSIERRVGVSGTYEEIGTTAPDVATYVDNTASPETTYFYRVRASEGGVYSGYSDEASVTTPSLPSSGGGGGNPGGGGSSGGGSGSGGGSSGGGGGGGGGGYFSPPTPATNVTITGSAYPASEVFILQDGQTALQTIAGPDGNFSASIGGLSGGNYTFSVYGQDDDGLRSSVFTFPVMITPGVTTMISGVFLSPTISVDKSEVKQGDTLVIFGKSLPSSTVMIQVNSTQTVFAQASSSASGVYLYDLDTSVLAMGSHSTKSKAESGNLISQESIVVGFTVGTQNISSTPSSVCPPNYLKADLNQDCHVNLVDFSILAYWYGKTNAPKAYYLDGKTTIDLADFSIMAYYWTG